MSLRPKITEPSELVKNFSNFYCDLLPNLYNIQCPKFLDEVKCALKDIRRLKFDINLRHENRFYFDIKYEQPSVRCAYMYAYNILNTVMVYQEFLKYLNTVKEGILRKLLGKKCLKICCLAGGPATEAIAVSKAIIDFCSKTSSKFDLFTDVEVTVVDIVSEWKIEGETLITTLNKSSNLFDTQKVQFHYKFLKADLVSGFDKILKKIVAEANVVTIVKLASSIEEKSASVCVSYLENMINNVTDCMTNNSCLFMLDVAGGKLFRHTMDVVLNQPNNYTMMSSLHKKYRLLSKTLQKMESCINFRNVAGTATLFPTVLTTISSCFWIKSQRKTKDKLPISKVKDAKTDQPVEDIENERDSTNKNKRKKGCNKNKTS